MPKISREERELLKEYEKGEWKSTKNKAKEIHRFQEYAKATLRKDKRINIRISAKDVNGLQKKAIEEGIPYQTLISSILHKYVSGKLAGK